VQAAEKILKMTLRPHSLLTRVAG